MTVLLLLISVSLQEEENQINGFVMIGNFDNLGWNHAKSMEKNYAKLMSGVLQVKSMWYAASLFTA